MSNNATFNQAGHLIKLFKDVTKEQFEVMKPLISDLTQADPTTVDREALRKVLGLIPAKIFVDYDMSLEAMIQAGHYEVVHTDITAKLFPLSGTGKVAFEHKLFHFNYNISSEDVIKKMNKQGFRPATIEELLAYGAALPEKQDRFPIIALGSIVEINNDEYNDRYVTSLGKGNSEYCLDLDWFDVVWSDSCRFLAVRKVLVS